MYANEIHRNSSKQSLRSIRSAKVSSKFRRRKSRRLSKSVGTESQYSREQRIYFYLTLIVELEEKELVKSIKIAQKIHADEVQRISYIKKIAQAQIDKLEMMKDLSLYEIEFANQNDFSDEI